jgi:hypothetical protein
MLQQVKKIPTLEAHEDIHLIFKNIQFNELALRTVLIKPM